MRYIKGKPILIFIIVLVALYVVIYVIPKVTGALQSTYTVEYGELAASDEAEGYIVRDEKVYYAGSGGDINRYIGEGKLVRKGTTVMQVSGDSDEGGKHKFQFIRENSKGVSSDGYITDEEGIVSYYADGYETMFSPANMTKRTYSEYRKLDNDDVVELKRDSTAKGDPVFKVSDRSSWYIVTFIDAKHKDRYEKNQKVDVEIGEELAIIGKVENCDISEGKLRLVIKTDYYYKDFARTRMADVRVITSSSRGLIVENTSITEKKGKQGVYVRQKTGEYEFTRIKVISTDGERSVIEKSYFFDDDGEPVSTVRNYDEVLRRA